MENYSEIKAPDRVKVGPLWYSIVWMDREFEDRIERFGEHDSNNQVIRLTKSRTRIRVATTFWHEVGHAINHVWGLAIDKKDLAKVEDFLCVHEYGWAGFAQDNPDAMAWYLDLVTRVTDVPFAAPQ
jgi:hypothetical protein